MFRITETDNTSQEIFYDDNDNDDDDVVDR